MGKFYNITLGVLVASVIALFALFFSEKKGTSKINTGNNGNVKNASNLPFAYFDVDSITNNYAFSKIMQTEVEKLQNNVEAEVNKLSTDYENKFNELKRKAQLGMKPEEQEIEMVALNRMKQENENKKNIAIENFQKVQQKYTYELKKDIQDFIIKFNTPQRFSFIIADEPGFIYYRDTMLNITNQLLTGLNEAYMKKK
jgi:outer membrane protein